MGFTTLQSTLLDAASSGVQIFGLLSAGYVRNIQYHCIRTTDGRKDTFACASGIVSRSNPAYHECAPRLHSAHYHDGCRKHHLHHRCCVLDVSSVTPAVEPTRRVLVHAISVRRILAFTSYDLQSRMDFSHLLYNWTDMTTAI